MLNEVAKDATEQVPAEKEEQVSKSHQRRSDFGYFKRRHIGPQLEDIETMLATVGASSMGDLIAKTVPAAIRAKRPLDLPIGIREYDSLEELRELSFKNKIYRSYIGLGFNDCITPPVIQRNILENPGWYTQYTPYQPEISQGRLEALLNFQTMVCDLTRMEVANASLLDEGTAAAEAMTLCARIQSRKKEPARSKLFVSDTLHPPTIEILKTRAEPLGIELVFGDHQKHTIDSSYLASIVQYPATDGAIYKYRQFAEQNHQSGSMVIAAADILSLALLEPPGHWGADVVVGLTQRFGVPLGYGGPHAAFIATKEEYRREIPGRIVGVSIDAHGKKAYRLALQTREQHIRRERATSNICTAQVLLAVIAGMYAVYHGPDGICKIAERVHRYTKALGVGLKQLGIELSHSMFFDTLRTMPLGERCAQILQRADRLRINFRVFEDNSLGITLDETTRLSDLEDILDAFNVDGYNLSSVESIVTTVHPMLPKELIRTDNYLSDKVFNSYRSETEMLRYINRLEAKDLSLTTSMIPLGSCTMKLNATSEMIPVTWHEFGRIHPFAPAEQCEGYKDMLEDLEGMLSEITGFPGISLQPNAGSQGEYAGLLVIRAYLRDQGQQQRDVCLIPASAHGTNPASAALAGMKCVLVKSLENGDIDVADLREKAAQHKDNLAALMVTYPSTHGVFEESIIEICEIVHQFGGQVYMDGANLNAQVGICRPAELGVDVCHLNLHKTFCIPHGGGGPGMGPIGVATHLMDYLPGHIYADCGGKKAIPAVSSSPWGSASILPISWVYIKMMGSDGLREATEVAILNANYIAARLEEHYPVLYRGANGYVAHECILDCRKFKHQCGVEVADIAKRLMDYGFHAPTVSFPVAETVMVEPTESESQEELDRFCDAMIAIRQEIEEVEQGKADRQDNVLKNAPHTAEAIATDDWTHPYSRKAAAYPVEWVSERKFWPAVGRIDAAFGDRNFCCTCTTVDEENPAGEC